MNRPALEGLRLNVPAHVKHRRLIDWARRYEVAVISDNPYSEICFDGFQPPSFLQVEGAKQVGVEFNSLSKAYNCCGWRTGMMLGNRDIIFRHLHALAFDDLDAGVARLLVTHGHLTVNGRRSDIPSMTLRSGGWKMTG